MDGIPVEITNNLTSVAAVAIALVPLYLKFRKDTREDRLESDKYGYEVDMKFQFAEEYRSVKAENKELQKQVNDQISELSIAKADNIVLHSKIGYLEDKLNVLTDRLAAMESEKVANSNDVNNDSNND